MPASVRGENLEKIAQDGFAEWNTPTGINFIKGSDTTIDRQGYDRQNIIAWGRMSASALGVTYIRYYPDTGEVVDLDTIMNKKYFWMWSDSSTCAYLDYYDAENILTHELGH